MNSLYRALPASGIREVYDKARKIEKNGEKVLHLEIGRPDWELPKVVVDDAKKALDDGFVHYIPNRGIPELRKAVAKEIAVRTGRCFDFEKEVIITSGASEALSICGLTLLGPGDEVIIPQPTWNHYEAVVRMAGATPIPLLLSAKDGFILDPLSVQDTITSRTKMIIINSPGNPTGAVQPSESLRAIAELAVNNGIYILTDEVYQDFVYEGEHASIAQYLGNSSLLIYINSLSKSYAMTGWRIGYLACESSLSEAFNRVHQYLTVCGVSFAQKGTGRLFQDLGRKDYLDDMRKAFEKRCSVWLKMFERCPGVLLCPPKGAFYLFPRIQYKGMSGSEFCSFMLQEHKVAMVPGDVFGANYQQYVRISYGGDLDTQRLAAAKLSEVLNG
jgi:aminotransferase